MVWLPTPSALVLKLAVVTPAVVVRLPLPIEMPPSKKFTVPVGGAIRVVSVLSSLGVAVKVVAWPTRRVWDVEAGGVVVLALVWTGVAGAEVEGLMLLSSA